MKKFSVLCMVMLLVMVFSFTTFAAEEEVDQAAIDAVTGPGVVGFVPITNENRIYGYGSTIIGVNGSVVSEANAYEKAPTYTDIRVDAPVDPNTIVGGPTTGTAAGDTMVDTFKYNNMIDEVGPAGIGGPDAINPVKYYDDGGPAGGSKIIYQPNNEGPTYTENRVDVPIDWSTVDMGPASSTEGYSKKGIKTNYKNTKG